MMFARIHFMKKILAQHRSDNSCNSCAFHFNKNHSHGGLIKHHEQGHSHEHVHSSSFKDTLAANNSDNGSGSSRVKVKTEIQGFLTRCSSKKINFFTSLNSHSLSKKSTFDDFKTAIASLANDISGKTSAQDMASSLTDLGEFLTRQPKPVDFKKRKQIADASAKSTY